MKSLIEYLNENKEDLLYYNKEKNRKEFKGKYDNLVFKPITSINILNKIIKNSEGIHKDGKSGFWLFKEAIRKGKEYTNIGGEPWEIQYTSVSYNNKIVGLISYSITYKSNIYKKKLFNNEKNNIPVNGNFTRIIDIQTLPGYSGFLKFYFQYIKEICESNKKKYITLQTYNKDLIGLYSKYGFKLYNNRYREMFVNIDDLKVLTEDKKELHK